jgi:hypothetical protein
MPRKQKKYHYIYKTTCQITGKFYVGMHSTDDLDDGYLGSGKILGYSRAKHGDENHKKEILEFLPDRVALSVREAEVVNEELLADPLCINLKYGGEGGWVKPSNDNRTNSAARLRQRHLDGKVRYDTFTNRNHSIEACNRIGAANSKRQAGENNSQFGTQNQEFS